MAETTGADDQIASVAALDEPVRRALYRYVVEHGGEVTRDQAAEALGISRALAVFHLDRLAEEHLLEVSFRRLTGKSGPGAGRPSKLYRRSSRQVDISLPPRSYELAARLLATAVEEASSPAALEALAGVAQAFGRSLGGEARDRAGEHADDQVRLGAAQQVLAAYGFEPCTESDGTICLRNCPFHTLAERHRELVCGMNLSLMTGVLDGLEVNDVDAVLAPRPGRCCVEFRPAATDASRAED